MNNSISAAAANAGGVSPSYPQKLTLSLQLEIEAVDAEHLEYLLSPEKSIQLGFIADLLDHLNFDMELGVQSINGVTPEDARKLFQKLL